ncbi:MAG: class I SAM-dependent RNA methyltransferase [Eubacteriales bacterium]|nr:class I SAM-dependent RNA methyltransferase [Eubacteriales bacterium]
MNEFTIRLTTSFGLESVLKKEVVRMGYSPVRTEDGSVFVRGSYEDILRLDISLRTANRVLIEVAEGHAATFDELYDLVFSVPWKEHLPRDAAFSVEKITSVSSALFSRSDCQSVIKKAAVEKMKKQYSTGTIRESGAYYPIVARIKKDVCSLYLNASGEPLNKRGYRLNKLKAPISETLAAGIVLLSGYTGGKEFADIMCGSGTIAIEAAMIASDTAPGLNRRFSVDDWHVIESSRSDDMRAQAKEKIHKPEYRILASDIDKNAVRTSISNAQRCGMDGFIAFQKADMKVFHSRARYGTIVTNPPYGERISDRKEAEMLYRDLRGVFDSLSGWELNVITANPEFQRCFGRKADKNRKLYNGNMLTYLYSYRENERHG